MTTAGDTTKVVSDSGFSSDDLTVDIIKDSVAEDEEERSTRKGKWNFTKPNVAGESHPHKKKLQKTSSSYAPNSGMQAGIGGYIPEGEASLLSKTLTGTMRSDCEPLVENGVKQEPTSPVSPQGPLEIPHTQDNLNNLKETLPSANKGDGQYNPSGSKPNDSEAKDSERRGHSSIHSHLLSSMEADLAHHEPGGTLVRRLLAGTMTMDTTGENKHDGPPTPSEPPLSTQLDTPQQTPLEASDSPQPTPPNQDPPQLTPPNQDPPQPTPPNQDPPQPTPPNQDPPQPTPPNQDPPQPPPPNRDPSQQVSGPLLPPDPLQINQTEISDVPSASESSQRRKDSPAVRLLQLIPLLQSIAMELGDMAPRIGDLHELTSALKSSHRIPTESGSNLESCLCCSGSYKNCNFGYSCNKIKRKSLKDGFLTALKQWKWTKNVARKGWKKLKNVIIILILLWRSGKIGIYVVLLVYHFIQLGLGIHKSIATGFILFVALSPFFSTFGVLVSLAHWLLFYIPNRRKINKTWCACCGLCIRVICTVCKCICCCCTRKREDDESGKDEGSAKRKRGESKSGEEEDSQKKGEESRRGEDEDSAGTKEKEGIMNNPTENHSTCASICCIRDEWQSTMKRLNSSQGRKWIIFVNIIGSLITVLDEILGTITFIFTLYAFIGNEGFYFHRYTPGDWIKFIFAYGLPTVIIISSHIIRIGEIGVNVKSLDKDIDSIPDEDIKRSRSEKIVSFQHGIIFHAVALGLLQMWFLVVLSWKIIRDHCLSQSEALQLGILTDNTEVYVGPLARCNVPDLRPTAINYFTVINIIYITIIFPILSYLILFISNLPLFVEYTQRLHASGLYKVEEMLNKALPGDEGGMESGIHTFFSIFFEIINVKPDKEFLLTKKKEIVELRKAVQEDMLGDYKKSGTKFKSTIFSPPTIVLGVIHVGLFLMNIGFLSCRYSLATNSLECSSRFDSFGAFTGSLLGDEALLIIPLLILFFLTGFPGPVITMLWIFVFIGVLMLVGSVILLIVLAVVVVLFLGSSGSNSTPTTR